MTDHTDHTRPGARTGTRHGWDSADRESHSRFGRDSYDRSPYGRRRDTLDRARDYLLSRPMECWAFFSAGVVLGAILG